MVEGSGQEPRHPYVLNPRRTEHALCSDFGRLLRHQSFGLVHEPFEAVCRRCTAKDQRPTPPTGPRDLKVRRIEPCRDRKVNNGVHPFFRVGGHRDGVPMTFSLDRSHCSVSTGNGTLKSSFLARKCLYSQEESTTIVRRPARRRPTNAEAQWLPVWASRTEQTQPRFPPRME